MGWFNHQPVCIHVFYPDVDTLWHKNVSWWVIWCHPVKLKPQMASFTRRVGQRKVNCLIQVKAPPVALSKREEICTVTSTYYRNTNTINVCLDGTLSTLNAMHILSFFQLVVALNRELICLFHGLERLQILYHLFWSILESLEIYVALGWLSYES